jgi:DNA-directed RNA polymerase subunit RPC12/RpoP
MVEQVKCPRCGRRLFDKERGSKGAIVIKCSHCRKIAKLKLEQTSGKGA